MLHAYAKVNLRLEIEKKLDDGYHYLHMINSKVSLCDDISLEVSDKNIIEFSIKDLNNTKNNIVLKVLEYIQKEYNIKERLHIYIKKRIPIGAGLGGGSSDAACVLIELNKRYGLGLTMAELEKIGLMFGADIPYCLHNKTCYVYGKGEHIYELQIKPLTGYLICPHLFISTKDAFENNIIYGNKLSLEVAQKLVDGSINKLFKNDFLNQMLSKYPELNNIYEILNKFGNVTLSGTGPSLLFIPYESCELSTLKEQIKDCDIFDIYIKE